MNDVAKNDGKAPSLQWYFRDWLTDERLKTCSYAAKGFWADIICQSCEMPIKGVFAIKTSENFNDFIEISDQKFPKKFVNFLKISEEKLVEMFSGKQSEKRKLLVELLRLNILKKSTDGTLYVQRIYRDTQLRTIRQEAGQKGGNPNFVKASTENLVVGLVGNLVNQNLNQKPPSSSSSSTTVYNNNYYKGDDQKILVNQKLPHEVEREQREEDIKKIIQRWNKLFPQQRENEENINLGYVITSAMSNPQRHTTVDDFLTAIDNYKLACDLPNSQAWKNYRLHGFLTKAIAKFWPEVFNIENFKKDNFDKKATNFRQLQVKKAKELVLGGLSNDIKAAMP